MMSHTCWKPEPGTVTIPVFSKSSLQYKKSGDLPISLAACTALNLSNRSIRQSAVCKAKLGINTNYPWKNEALCKHACRPVHIKENCNAILTLT